MGNHYARRNIVRRRSDGFMGKLALFGGVTTMAAAIALVSYDRANPDIVTVQPATECVVDEQTKVSFTSTDIPVISETPVTSFTLTELRDISPDTITLWQLLNTYKEPVILGVPPLDGDQINALNDRLDWTNSHGRVDFEAIQEEPEDC